jgi:glycosyltransferase involved in cell wall biosynthesis
MTSDSRSDRLVVHVPRRFTHNSWGGTERVLEQTLPLLKDHHFRSMIYTSQALDDQILGEVSGTPVSRFPYFYPEWPQSRERKLAYDHKAGNTMSPALASSLAALPDLALVHCHTGNLLGAQCLRVAKKRDVPTVLTLHGGHFAIPAQELKNLSHRNEKSRRLRLPVGRMVSLALGARKLLENVDAVVCVGLDEYEAARAALPNQKVIFLPGGVNLEEFNKANRERGRRLVGVEGDRLLITCIARVDRQKDQATLVEAWARHCSVDCDLAVVGPETSAGYVQELQALARGARGRLIITGGIAPEEMPHAYAAADISVLPSCHEPFGLTCLESWAAGTALVCSDVGGPGWLLKDQKEGQLFPVGDAKALGGILQHLLTDEPSRKQFADAGRSRVAREFSWKKRAASLSALYEELLEKRR